MAGLGAAGGVPGGAAGGVPGGAAGGVPGGAVGGVPGGAAGGVPGGAAGGVPGGAAGGVPGGAAGGVPGGAAGGVPGGVVGGAVGGVMGGISPGAAEFEEAAGAVMGARSPVGFVEATGDRGVGTRPDAAPGLVSASSSALPPAVPRWELRMLMRRAAPKNIPAEYLVMVVRALPEPAPKSASVAAPPNAMPAPASFLGNCSRIKRISTMLSKNRMPDKKKSKMVVIIFLVKSSS